MDTHPIDTEPTSPGRNPDPEATGGAPLPLPLVVRMEGAPCLVVGAGPTAARKARTLLGAGAVVTVVAPEIGDGVRALVDAVRPVGVLTVAVRSYAPPEAADYFLVVSATGDAGVDARVTADALAGGALVNRADTVGGVSGNGGSGDPEGRTMAGTVVLPAVHRVGPVTVTVSTDGSSPALARWLRDRIAVGVGPDMATMAGLVDERRRAVLEAGGTLEAVDWPGVFDEVAPLVAAGRLDEARSILVSRIVTTGQTPPH